MAKFVWQDGTLVSKAKVEIGGTIYEVDPEEYSGSTPLSASNLNAMVDSTYSDLQEYVDKAIITYGVNAENLTFKTTQGYQGFNIKFDKIKYSKNVNNKFTLNNDGFVTIGKGITHVKISANFSLNRGQSGYIKTYITKNGDNNFVAIGGNAFTDYYPASGAIPSELVEVNEGDVIGLRFNTSADAGKTLTCSQSNYTISLTLEEV